MASPSVPRPSTPGSSISKSAMRTSALCARLSPDELRELADSQIAQAGGTESGCGAAEDIDDGRDPDRPRGGQEAAAPL
jgi:hypothetical protein